MKKIENTSTEGNIRNKIYVVVGILIFFLIFYLLTLYITNKNSNSSTETDTDESVEVSISNEKIIVGRSLSMSDGEYFVLYYDKSDEDIANTYDEIVDTYRSKEDSLSLYVVDMSSSFNLSFTTSEESNKNPETVNDFRINGPTLIRVNEHKVVDYVEGETDILSILS